MTFLIKNYFLFQILIPLVYGFINYKKLNSTLKLLSFYLAYILSLEITALFFARLFRFNLHIYNIGNSGEIIFICIILYTMRNFFTIKFNPLYLIPPFILLTVIFYLLGIDNLFSLTNYSTIIFRILLFILSLIYLINFSLSTREYLHKTFQFWLVFGLILNYSTNILFLIAFKIFPPEVLSPLLFIPRISNFLVYSSFFLSIFAYLNSKTT